jgi:hypothetical protein
VAAEFGRAVPPFSGVSTVPGTWCLTIHDPTLLHPWAVGFEKAVVPAIQETVFFNPASIFGSPARRRSDATRHKWRPSRFSSFPARWLEQNSDWLMVFLLQSASVTVPDVCRPAFV